MPHSLDHTDKLFCDSFVRMMSFWTRENFVSVSSPVLEIVITLELVSFLVLVFIPMLLVQEDMLHKA